jgi:hypothetical protein
LFACDPQDQTLGLAALGIQGTALTSLTSKDEAAAIYKRLDDPQGNIRLLYGALPGQHPVIQRDARCCMKPRTWRLHFLLWKPGGLKGVPAEHTCRLQNLAQFSGPFCVQATAAL